MKAQLGIVLLGAAVFLAVPAWSQNGTGYVLPIGTPDSSQMGSQDGSQQDGSQSGSADSSQSSNGGPTPAYTNPEQLPPLALLGDVTAETGMHLGMSVGSFYDTNSGFNAHPQPVTYTFINPTIGFTQIRPTLSWTFNYSGGVSLNSETATSTYIYNVATVDILQQISSRWQMHVHDGFSYSNDPFTPYLTYTHDPTPNQPNPTIYVPQAVGEQNRAVIDLTHIMGAHDSISFTGSESYSRYLDTSYTGFNNYSWGGRTNYNHIFTQRFSAGGGFNYYTLDFAHGQTRSGTTMMIGFVEYQINPNMTISGWVGPEYTTTKDIIPQFCYLGQCYGYTVSHQSAWDMAYGSTFAWKGQRNAMQAAFSRQISDGGGLLGTVQLYMVTAGYTRQLTPRWALTGNFLYGANHSTSLYYADRYINSTTASIWLRRQFSAAWQGSVSYAYLHENQANIYQYPTWNDNRFGFRIQYLWGHSLGR